MKLALFIWGFLVVIAATSTTSIKTPLTITSVIIAVAAVGFIFMWHYTKRHGDFSAESAMLTLEAALSKNAPAIVVDSTNAASIRAAAISLAASVGECEALADYYKSINDRKGERLARLMAVGRYMTDNGAGANFPVFVGVFNSRCGRPSATISADFSVNLEYIRLVTNLMPLR